MSSATIVIVLELDESADCPSGSAAVAGGSPRQFHGWLGLATAIAALTHSSDTSSTPPTKGATA